ncbi:hypothetical protein NE556_23935, partial [[Clostridium] symbiosum]|nr:hypothetical protein [[Clostridium] symbiosum]
MQIEGGNLRAETAGCRRLAEKDPRSAFFINLIDRANRIVAIGVGRSKITTEALVSRLYRIGYYI